MLTRDTHARIYQGEVSGPKLDILQKLSNKKKLSLSSLILFAITDYLKDRDFAGDLDIEAVKLSSENVRLYLWVPYKTYYELEKFMKIKGIDIRGLTIESLRKIIQKDDLT